MRIRYMATIPAAALALMAATPAPASAQTFSAEYSISYLGITVAKSSFTSHVYGSKFRMDGSISSAGLGAFFDSTKGTTVSYGDFAESVTRPEVYIVDYNYGDKAKRTALSFTNGKLTGLVNTPDLPPRRPDWVNVTEADLRSVADPISATLVRASSPGNVCGRTIQIFDGEFRADIVLTPSKAKPEEPGTVACTAKLVPVSGYHAGNASLKYMRDKSKIQIAFAPLGQTGVYAPVFASVGTQFGPVTIRAKRVSVIN